MRSRAFWIKSYLLLILVGVLFIKVIIPAFSGDYVQMPDGSQKQVESWVSQLEKK